MKDSLMQVPTRCGACLAFVFSLGLPLAAGAGFYLGPEELVHAGGVPIQVIGGAAPSFADWNNDELPDLVVGEGSSFSPGRVRVYLNIGGAGAPLFGDYFFAQSLGDTLAIDGVG